MPAIIVGCAFLLVVVASAFGGSGNAGPGGDPSANPTLAPSVGGSPTAAPGETPPSVATPSPPPTVKQKVPLERTIKNGSKGDDVTMIQQRLVDLKFDPGTVDGIYGGMTMRSVWAFQKLVLGIPRNKISDSVTPELWDRMQDEISVKPRRTELTATHVEVHIPQQVMVVYQNNAPRLITHISTGSLEEWCAEVTKDPGTPENDGSVPIVKGECGYSATPAGMYKFDWRWSDGWREGSLGKMYKPIYFNRSIAVHGSLDVPNRPASHGCVRIPMHIAEYFQTLIARGDQIFVFDDVKEPEEYGSPPLTWNWPDPSWVPPTTVGTTVPATTLAPKPTAPPTTKAPATTTTKPPAPTTTKAPAPPTTKAAPPTTKPAPATTVPATTAAPTTA